MGEKGQHINMIVYSQDVKVIEKYRLEYNEYDFKGDCEGYKITDFIYEELELILTDRAPDKEIEVSEFDIDPETDEYKLMTHKVSAREFFTELIKDYAFQYGYGDRDEIELYDRTFDVQ